MSLIKTLSAYNAALVHPSVRGDTLMAARHRAFIAPRLFGSLIALAALPVYVIMRGPPGALEVAVFAWLAAPILIGFFLSRTGMYERAHVLYASALTGLVTLVAAQTGGIGSFAAIWLVIVPLEASLSASRRVVVVAATLALAAAGLLSAFDFGGWWPLLPPARDSGALAALGVVSASLYASGLALGAQSLARANLGLREAEEDRYRLLARNMTDVITRHGRNGIVLFLSPAAESLFGASLDDLRGHGLFDRIHVADRPAYLKALADAALSGEQCSAEFRIRADRANPADPEAHHAVTFIWIEMRCRPLGLATKMNAATPPQSREVVAVLRDVTGRKEQERVLAEARALAERADASKNHFLAAMSHELRTPLNAIIGFSDMLMNADTLRIEPERRLDYAGLINESGTHLLSVVNGILDMSKIGTGEFEIRPEAFTVEPVVHGCCNLLGLKAREAGIIVHTDVAAGLPELIADRRAVKQMLLNLLSNAIKFTDRGGRVGVAVTRDFDEIVFVVSDSGIGISAEDLPRIGSPFFQARSSYDRPHDGTGLGLSIVRGLVELHGGRLTIESRIGEGTSVTVCLPIDFEAAKGDGGQVHRLPGPSSDTAAAIGTGDKVRKSA